MNADRRESDFALVPPETLELWKNTGIAPKSGPNRSDTSGPITRDEKAELWWWVLAMLAVLAIAESVLGNRQMTAAASS